MSKFACMGFALLAVVAVFTSCTTTAHTSLSASDVRPDGARLTQAQVVSIAKQEVEREGFRLTDYREPDAVFRIQYGWRSRSAYWTVGLESKVPFPGGHTFTVFVDDQTQKAKLTL